MVPGPVIENHIEQFGIHLLCDESLANKNLLVACRSVKHTVKHFVSGHSGGTAVKVHVALASLYRVSVAALYSVHV